MSQWPSTKARLVLAALQRIDWRVKRQSGTSHRVLSRPGWPDYVFAFHDREEIGPHFAFAVAYEMDYLLTWNCAHIANGEIIRRLLDVNAELNRFTPLIVTPEEILESPEKEEL